jgi:hypothetical protein
MPVTMFIDFLDTEMHQLSGGSSLMAVELEAQQNSSISV